MCFVAVGVLYILLGLLCFDRCEGHGEGGRGEEDDEA